MKIPDRFIPSLPRLSAHMLTDDPLVTELVKWHPRAFALGQSIVTDVLRPPAAARDVQT